MNQALLFFSDSIIHCVHIKFVVFPPKDIPIHFESEHWFILICHELVLIALYILFLLCFSFQGSSLWEDGVVLKRTEFYGTAFVQGLAIVRHLIQILLWGHSRVRFRSHGLWYGSCSQGILSQCKGQFQVSVPLIIMVLPFNFQEHTQGTSGSSVLSEES